MPYTRSTCVEVVNDKQIYSKSLCGIISFEDYMLYKWFQYESKNYTDQIIRIIIMIVDISYQASYASHSTCH